MKAPLQIESDIKHAETIDKSFYLSPEIYEQSKDSIFWKCWHFVGKTDECFTPEVNIVPATILKGYLDEEFILTKNENQYNALSNVCTHRGYKLVHEVQRKNKIICGYHGRRFNLEGRFEFMPEFKEAENFPRPCDHLARLKLEKWRELLFVAPSPSFEWKEIAQIMQERLYFLPIEQYRFSPLYSKEYMVHAHWALYVDNYLEGFHIPFVHKSLNELIDYGQYETIQYEHCNMQIAYSSSDADFCFDLPEGHPDFGRKVTAFYYWVFPNLMFNFYPWGVQINTVMPLGLERCKVLFLNYIYDMDVWNANNYGQLSEKVEREDEFVVEGVQQGLKSRFYQAGRFSPKREQCVHHFHKLLTQYLSDSV